MTWILPEEFDVQQVVMAHAHALAQLDEQGSLDIDGRAVRRADAAAVQLLVAVAQDAGRREAPCVLHASDALANVIDTLGLSAALRQVTATPTVLSGV